MYTEPQQRISRQALEVWRISGGIQAAVSIVVAAIMKDL